MSSTIAEVGIFKDLEVIWVDRYSQLPKDMDNVTVEIYHYEEEKPATLIAPNPEPYYITEGLTDSVNIASVCPTSGYSFDAHYTMQLDVVCNDLDALGCPPNNYVVPGTNNKVSIQNSNKVFALSACELAQIINLNASGYTAYSENGFLVLKSNFMGASCYLQVGNGTFNSIVGFNMGDQAYGDDTKLVYDMTPQAATWISTGRYVYPHVELSVPPYIIGERYYVLFRATEPITGNPELYQEDFTLVDKISGSNQGLNFSFIG